MNAPLRLGRWLASLSLCACGAPGARNPALAPLIPTSPAALTLTFDGVPTAPELSAALRRHGVQARFFIGGDAFAFAAARQRLRMLLEDGHSLGNGTFDGADLTRLSDAEISTQLTAVEQATRAALGEEAPPLLWI
ncbi:MAG TPA: polysaccharide deacetylase family protein, partial [Myxococcota bacterium]|nr:polysaccharide deacetylase family protein [Myxococcota bacterium]